MDPREQDLALIREVDVIGCRRRGIAPLYSVSRSEWRQGVREKRYPQPVKIPGKHLTFWRRAEVIAMLRRITEGAG